MSRYISLFSESDWFSVERNARERIEQEVAGINEDRLLITPVDDLVEYFVKKYSFDVPTLMRDDIHADQPRETKIDKTHDFNYLHRGEGRLMVDGTEVTVTIPFTGDFNLFRVQPTTFSHSPPRAILSPQSLQLRFADTHLNGQQIRTQTERMLSEIESNLGYLRRSSEGFNANIAVHARAHIEKRREKLLAARSMVDSIGFKVTPRADQPATYKAPEVQRKLVPSLPPASNKPFKPEPVLESAVYEHILQVLDDCAIVMERSPSAFSSMGEEALRWQFLVQLNGHYKGEASGETFNYEGKTDILIKSGGKNVFIGECKFWGGPKLFNQTIDQLLGYSSWRDTKVALLVFNRNKDFTAVLEAMHKAAQEHPNFKRFIKQRTSTSYQYTFRNRDDANRELTLTVMAFDVPKGE